MTGPPRDWDKEMAEIDKLIAKEQGARPPGAAPPLALRAAPAPAPRGAAAVARDGRGALAAWVRVLLGVAVAGGVTLAWPYRHVCGLPLYGYVAAAAGVTLAGLWGVVSTWKRRLALAHVIAVLVALSGAILVGKAVLDRSGYPKHPLTWRC